MQEGMISSLRQKHDKNLLFISAQLFEMQRKLMKKEKYLSQLISEREQVGANCGQIIPAQSRVNVLISAANRSIGSTTGFHNHGEGPY